MIATFGALKTLLFMLQSAPTLQGVSVVFGEEQINAEDFRLPMVAVVPIGGPWVDPSYIKNVDPEVDNIFATNESIELYMWTAVDPNSNPPPQPIDNADAVEALRAGVLQAFQAQRPSGLYFKPTTGRWERMGDGQNRYGRGYVLTVQVEIAIPCLPYTDGTVREVTINPSI